MHFGSLLLGLDVAIGKLGKECLDKLLLGDGAEVDLLDGLWLDGWHNALRNYLGHGQRSRDFEAWVPHLLLGCRLLLNDNLLLRHLRLNKRVVVGWLDGSLDSSLLNDLRSLVAGEKSFFGGFE